eukprot:6491349-Amphidinium_carterae.6
MEVPLPSSVSITSGGCIAKNWSASDACVVDSQGLEVYKCCDIFKAAGTELNIASTKDIVKKFFAEAVKSAELEFESQGAKTGGAAAAAASVVGEGNETGVGRGGRRKRTLKRTASAESVPSPLKKRQLPQAPAPPPPKGKGKGAADGASKAVNHNHASNNTPGLNGQ